MDLICKSDVQIGNISSFFFIGFTVTSLIFPTMADWYGRKWIQCLSLLTVNACMVGLIFSRSLDLTLWLMFFVGCATPGKSSVGFVYGNEFLAYKWRVLFGSLYMLLDGMTVILSAIYFGWVSDKYVPFSALGPIFGTLGFIGIVFFMPESPIWLLKKGRVE